MRHTHYRAAMFGITALFLGACAQTQTTGTDGQIVTGFIAKPTTVMVSQFDFAPEIVIADRNLVARVAQEMKGKPSAAIKAETAQRVSNVITETAIAALRDAGLKASPGSVDIALGDEPTLIITGRVRGPEPAKNAKSKSTTFSGVKSPTVADVQLTHMSWAGRKNILNFTTEPGARSAPVRGGAAGGGSEKLSPDVAALARRIGNDIASRVIAFAGQHGWVRDASTVTPVTPSDSSSQI
ncbi:MAG: hypothetical protein HY659_08015 [Rhizobiales bacterium]|nr:hypothetical protein [Hyphomicrobiales bacterium]